MRFEWANKTVQATAAKLSSSSDHENSNIIVAGHHPCRRLCLTSTFGGCPCFRF
jgi:hypothetical protein